MTTSRQLYFNQQIAPSFWQSYAITMAPIVLKQLTAIGRDNLPIEFSKSVVIIETRDSSTLPFTIYNSILLTEQDVGLELYVSANLYQIVRDIVVMLRNVRINTIPEITSITDYNKLLVGTTIWSSLQAETVLLVQIDSLLIKTLDWEPFKDVDYVGAPWNKTEIIKIPWPDGTTVDRCLNKKQHLGTNRVGNGGFSLRRVDAMLETISKYPYSEFGRIGLTNLPEDIYFSRYIDRVASYELGKTFATETDWNPNAFGMHKIWEYQPVAHLIELLQLHYLNVSEKQPKQPSSNKST